MNKIILVFFCLSLIINSGCYEKIDFEIDSKTFVVVDALFKPNTSSNKLTLSLLEEGQSVFVPITTASVFIENTKGESYNLIHREGGEYSLNTPLSPDEEYKLIFEWDDVFYSSDFESFGSGFTELKELEFEASEAVFYNVNGNKEVNEVLDIYLTLSSDALNYTLFEYDGVYKIESIKTEANPYANICWFKDNGVDFLKTAAVNGKQKIRFLRTLPTSKYRFYNLFIKSYSISESAYRYWRELEDLRNESGGIFSAPPSIVRGNINAIEGRNSVEVLGYFTLGSLDSVRFEFNEDNLPVTLKDDCLPVSDSLPDVCFDCALRSDTISVNNPPQLWLNP